MSQESCQSPNPTLNISRERQYPKALGNRLSTSNGELSQRLTDVSRCSNRDTIAHLYRSDGCSHLKLSELVLALENRPEKRAVVAIENIDIEGMSLLGEAWGVDPGFFITHSQNPTGQSLWRSIFKPSSVENKKTKERINCVIDTSADSAGQAGVLVDGSKKRWHVDGLFQLATPSGVDAKREDIQARNALPRRLELHSSYGYQSNTRVSCLSVRGCYLILVDTLPNFARSRQRPSSIQTKINLPISQSRGGLILPQLFDRQHFTLMDCLDRFFSHAWHFDVLFGKLDETAELLEPENFFYLVATSLWTDNHRAIRTKIRHIAFEDIRRPSIEITNSLHDCRQSLDALRTDISYTKAWVPPIVHQQLTELRKFVGPDGYVGLPGEVLHATCVEAEATEKLLMDTYQLLMNSISVLDSQTSIQQAHRGQILTQLALVYLPFSFVTGIFGMNVREINGSSLSIWLCLPVLVVTLIVTVLLLKFHTLWVIHAIDVRRPKTEVRKRNDGGG